MWAEHKERLFGYMSVKAINFAKKTRKSLKNPKVEKTLANHHLIG